MTKLYDFKRDNPQILTHAGVKITRYKMWGCLDSNGIT